MANMSIENLLNLLGIFGGFQSYSFLRERGKGRAEWIVGGADAVVPGGGSDQWSLAEVTAALLQGGGAAITLALTLGGAMCLWGGLLRVAEKGGLTQAISRLLAPLMRLLFLGLIQLAPPAGPF